MRAAGQSIAALTQSLAPSRALALLPPSRLTVAGILAFLLANLVAIAAFLAAAPRARAETPGAKTVSVFVTPVEMRSGALLLRSDNAAHSASEDARERAFPSEASGQRGYSNKVRAPDTRPGPGSSAHAALDAYAAVAVANAPKPVVLRSVAVPAAHLSC